MNPRALFIRMGKIFPNPVAMEDIRMMKRRKLSPEEKKKPYAKYFYKELAGMRRILKWSMAALLIRLGPYRSRTGTI